MLELARRKAQLPRSGEVQLPRENIYGHYARLEWLRDQLDQRSDHGVESGCGTGYMLTLPRRVWGFSNLLFTGFRRIVALNVALGRRWPALASGLQLVGVPGG